MGMSSTGILSVSSEDMEVAAESEFVSAFENNSDFVQNFPPELSNNLFTYLTDKDVYACSQSCFAWRQVINNNAQWKLRCLRRGWGSKSSGEEEPFKMTRIVSHVGDVEPIFRQTPLFYLPPVASLRMERLCDWALYFRQRLHLESNWKVGRHVIHKMHVPEAVLPAIYNTFDCNGKFFAAGTTLGYVLIWSVIGQPTFVKSILVVRRRVEIELIQMTDLHMAVLCQSGLLIVYNLSSDPYNDNGKEPFEILYKIRIAGNYLNEYTYRFTVAKLSEEESLHLTHQEDPSTEEDEDILLWIRELFQERHILDSDYMTSDIFFSICHHKIVLSGLYTDAIYILDVHTGNSLKRVELPSGMQLCYKFHVNDKNIYLSTRRVLNYQALEPTFHLLVYNLAETTYKDTYEVIDFQNRSMAEEIQGDLEDSRVVWVGQDSMIVAKELKNKTTLFVRTGQSYIDNLTVYQEQILYHQFNGFIIAIDWTGVTCYEIEMKLGLVRGLECSKDFLVSGGDERNLTVWNRETGDKYHQVYHQPCRIERLWMDGAKIITLGREDPPVLVGFW